MSGNEWLKVWNLTSDLQWASDSSVRIEVSVQEDARASLDAYQQNVEDVAVLLAFCAYLGSDEDVFRVRERELAELRVVSSRYGSPLELFLDSWGMYAAAVLAGAGTLAKVLKWVAEARKANQEALEIKDRRRREREDERLLSEALTQMMVDLDARGRRQVSKILRGLEGRKREVRLARALGNLTDKDLEVRINPPDRKG